MSNMMNSRCVACLVTAFLGGAVMAQGDSDAEPDAPLAEKRDAECSLSLNARARHTFRADLDDDEGNVSITRVGAGVSVSLVPADRLRLVLSLDNEFSWYDFSSDAGTTLDDIIDEGVEHELSLRATWMLTDTTSITVLAGINSGYEPGADFGDSLTYQGGLAYGFRVSDDLTLGLGVGVRSRLEDDALVLPILIANWRVNDQTTLTAEGLGATLTVAMNERTDFHLRAWAELHEFRLDDDNNALPGGVLSDYRVPVALGVTWKPADGLSLTVEGGAIVWQEYELRDDDDKLADTNTDPAAFVGVRVSWTF